MAICGVALAGFTAVTFALTNAGLDPQADHLRDVDPTAAASVCFGLLGLSGLLGLFGLYHCVVIIFFGEDNSSKSAKAPTDPRIARVPDSHTGFIRQPPHVVFSVGPVFAGFSAASVFIWHIFAKHPGTPGTVWGDYTTSGLPVLVLFLACWATANVGFTFTAIAEAVSRDRKGLFRTAMILMFVVAGAILVCFFSLPGQPTESALTIAAGACSLSLVTSVGSRAWAIARVAQTNAENTVSMLSAPQSFDVIQSPHDMLEHGEDLILHFRSDRTPEPQLLIATTTRFVRASILHPDRTFILEQARPDQLVGVSSERMGPDLVTIAHFRDRQDMRIVGGNPVQSRNFAEAANRLARTGK